MTADEARTLLGIWARAQGSRAAAGERLGCTGQHVRALLAGQAPGRRLAISIEDTLGIPIRSWDAVEDSDVA